MSMNIIPRAMTMVELMLVVVILGIIAGIALPAYRVTMEKTHETDAIVQLSSIHSANKIYFARTGKYWPTGGSTDLTAINANLNLQVVANGMEYSCQITGADNTFTCTAERDAPAASFTIEVTEDPLDATNPGCISGACP